MSQSYAALLAQVIPIIALAQVFEMREISRRADEPAPDGGHHHLGMLFALSLLMALSLAVLALGEVWALLAAAGAGAPGYVADALLAAMIFGLVVTFLVPAGAWCYSLGRQLAAQHAGRRTGSHEPGAQDAAPEDTAPSRRLRPRIPALTLPTAAAAVAGAVAVTLFVLGTIQVFSLPKGMDAVYQSGDQPHTVERGVPCGGGYAPCSVTVLEAYEWTFDPGGRAAVRTTFGQQVPQTSHPAHHLKGQLGLLPGGCPGARVEWRVSDGGTTVASGELDDQRPARDLVGLPAPDPEVTVEATRTDRRPCTVILRWDDPGFNDPRAT